MKTASWLPSLTIVILLFFSQLTVNDSEKASKTSRWQRKACLSACKQSQELSFCRRKCASIRRSEKLVTRQVGNKTIEEDDRCTGKDLAWIYSKTVVPSCRGAIHTPDCIRQAGSPSVGVAGPPSLNVEFLTDNTDKLVGSFHWTMPSGNEGVQIRIFTYEQNPLLVKCLEIHNPNPESTCKLNSSLIPWNPNTMYKVQINSVPLPSNCSPAMTTKNVLSPSCSDGNCKDESVSTVPKKLLPGIDSRKRRLTVIHANLTYFDLTQYSKISFL